jgi:hypothetical protein
MTNIIDTILLLALPASGKSEVRRYLEHQPEETCREHFHMGPTAQLDDYPYVHLMRRVDDTLAEMGAPRAFFEAPDRGFATTLDWGTLIELVNEDYRDLRAAARRTPDDSSRRLFERFDRARKAVGASPIFSRLTDDTRRELGRRLGDESAALAEDWNRALPPSLEGRTVVIEFARGGPQGSAMPLPEGYGYRHSLSRLSPEILERAAILYIWVTPEQSRAKNEERARPGADGSILFHGVPIHVMLNDYGCDDMEHLLGESRVPGCVQVESGGRLFSVPAGRFDNRGDLTTFLREDATAWTGRDVDRLRAGISAAMDEIWAGYAGRFGG